MNPTSAKELPPQSPVHARPGEGMKMRSPLLLLAAANTAATTVEVRFTADFADAVTSTSSASCRGGAYRAHALNVASSADALAKSMGVTLVFLADDEADASSELLTDEMPVERIRSASSLLVLPT